MNTDNYATAYRAHPGISLQTLLGREWSGRRVSIVVVRMGSQNRLESCVANAFFVEDTANKYVERQYPMEFSDGRAYVLNTTLANVEARTLKFKKDKQISKLDAEIISDYLIHKLLN